MVDVWLLDNGRDVAANLTLACCLFDAFLLQIRRFLAAYLTIYLCVFAIWCDLGFRVAV
jgi:hypothetical protein